MTSIKIHDAVSFPTKRKILFFWVPSHIATQDSHNGAIWQKHWPP